jgi:hypothetical protein
MACVQQVPGVSSKRLTEWVAPLWRIASPVLYCTIGGSRRCFLASLVRIASAMSLACLTGHICHIINMTDGYELLNM